MADRGGGAGDQGSASSGSGRADCRAVTEPGDESGNLQETTFMLTGLYSAGTAMQAASRHHEVIAQNLAHAQMPGYRRLTVRHGSFESALNEEMQAAVARQSMGTDASELAVDFSQGTIEQTDHPLDVALQGKGFFAIEGPDGPLYTRNGTFQLNEQGQIVTGDGMLVRGSGGGEIAIPPGVAFKDIQILKDGRILAGDMEAGRLEIVDFDAPQRLIRAGVTVFSAPPGLVPHESDATVLQGMRERSNVSPVQELVEMIDAQRRHEAAQRSMTLLSDAIRRHIDLRGGV